MSFADAYDLIKMCLSSTWSEKIQSKLRFELKYGSINWDGFLLTCEEQACSPLVYQALSNSLDIPKEVDEKLKKSFLNCGSANLIYFHELEINLNNFNKIGIQTVLLKGAALALTLYNNIALRPMLDIDLLIKQTDFEKASLQLLELGYSQTQLNPHNSNINLYENEAGFGKQGAIDYLFELHWSLFDSPFYQTRLPIEWFWQNLIPIRFNDVDAFVFRQEAQLLHLCGHLQLHHGGKELLWLNDIARLLVKYEQELNWDEIIDRAQIFDLVLPLKLTLHDLASDWDIPISYDILERINQLVPSAYEKRIFTRLTRQLRPVGIRLRDDLESMPTLQHKIQFALTNLFPSTAYMTKHYRIEHPFLLPFYYIYRWYLGARSLGSRNK